MMDWIWFDGLAGNQGKADPLGKGREQQVALHHSKVQADTDARACTEQDDPAFWDAVAINLYIAQRTPGEGIGRWVESHSFLEDLQAVGQMCQISISGSATLQDAIDFLLYLLITLRMLAEEIPGPGESGCGCFMPCAKEGQALGHQLHIAHGVAIFVSGL